MLHYALNLPADITGPVDIEVRVHYRKLDTRHLKFIEGEAFDHNDLPVTLLTSDRIRLRTAEDQKLNPVANLTVPAWERWNDYGIGLLRKGGLGDLRHALSCEELIPPRYSTCRCEIRPTGSRRFSTMVQPLPGKSQYHPRNGSWSLRATFNRLRHLGIFTP